MSNNLKLILTSSWICWATVCASAQNAYFQQEVNYVINVTLDDKAHTVTGDIAFEYVNHSPNTLSEIWVHVWPNAFKNRRSAYCKQTLRQGSGKFYFAPDSSLGACKLLDFTVNGARAEWKYDPRHPDIARITLPQPLAPEARVTIATPFSVKVPASFSRLGHVGTSYQMTQWFPKPAVYDREGWHAMPYLNQGEFYSEFGNFDVQITLPDNYVVGATGQLQTESEWAFLRQKEAETRKAIADLKQNPPPVLKGKKKKEEQDPFPASSSTLKTIRYKAEKVHDFAWFADKRFYVLKDTARLASGKTVDCWGMFTKSDFNYWEKGAFYVKRAVEFYSQHVGEYPWPQATAVHSALSAGGGMEYPMITVIGNSGSGRALDNVITHEVGHNWFYGLLATNEREHPWMDEGMNSYYEQRYMRTYYGSDGLDVGIPKSLYDPEVYGSFNELGILALARIGANTPGDLNSDKMTNVAYGLQVYMKTAHCLRWLENAVGTEKFDAAMKAYYRDWHFKHPRPIDFVQTMRQNGIDVDWFMSAMKTQKNADPAITKARKDERGHYQITVRQRGQITAPFSVTAIKNGQALQTKWFSPEKGQTRFDFGPADADAFELNYEHLALDVHPHNNQLRTSGLFKRANPLRLKLVAPVEHPKKRTLGLLPWLGGNHYDGFMLGPLFYNPLLPGQKLQYYIAPGFGFKSGEPVGAADLRYRIHPVKGPIQRITVGLNARSFNDQRPLNAFTAQPFNARYYRVTPSIKADFRSSNTAIRQSVQLRWHLIGQEANFDTSGVQQKEFTSHIPEARYQFANMSLPNPFELNLALEHQNWQDGDNDQRYLRLSAEWKQHFYYQAKRRISARFFGGYFLENTWRDRKAVGFGANDQSARGTFSLAQNGYTDYKYDYLYVGRNQVNGLGGRQVQLSEGGFKYAFNPAFAGSGDVGHSNNYLFALNLEADLPKRLPLGLPLKPYFDIGYADLGFVAEGGPKPENLFWSGGFMLSFLKGAMNIYFPAINSDNINARYVESSGGNYLRRITWSVKMNGWEPWDLADRFNK